MKIAGFIVAEKEVIVIIAMPVSLHPGTVVEKMGSVATVIVPNPQLTPFRMYHAIDASVLKGVSALRIFELLHKIKLKMMLTEDYAVT